MKIHDDAFLALIRSDPALADTTFEGTVDDRPKRYVSVFAREARSVNRWTGPHGSSLNEYIVHAVGQTPDQAKGVRERMLAKTLDVTPQVAGWNSRRIYFVTSQPLGRDDDVNPPLFYTVDVLAFESERL